MEHRFEEVFAPLIEGLTATRHIVVGNGPTAHLEEVPDIPTRMTASRDIVDRLEGRPRQTTESKVEVHTKDQMDREIERLTEQLNVRDGVPAR